MRPTGPLSSVLDMEPTAGQEARLAAAHERVTDTKRDYDQARADRDDLIREMALVGLTYRAISDHVGVAYQRIFQIVGVPDTRPRIEDVIGAPCSRCGAQPGEPCEGKGGRFSFHAQRYDAFNSLREAAPSN